VDTRTSSGRDAYDRAILDALKSSNKPTAASTLRGTVGGTADQARRALNRLIENGSVGYTGKARGTRYRSK